MINKGLTRIASSAAIVGCLAWVAGCVGAVDANRGNAAPADANSGHAGPVQADETPAAVAAPADGESMGDSNPVQGSHWMNPRLEHSPPPALRTVPETSTRAGLLQTRRELVEFLWGSDGFPVAKLPTSVERDVASPVSGLSNLERVDALHLTMDSGIESLAYHFIPHSSKRDRAVIVHHGHATTFDDDPSLEDKNFGLQRTIKNLLLDGFGVVAVFMPGCLPPAAGCSDHTAIVETPTTGHGLKFFLEPVAVYLNYLQAKSAEDSFSPYTDFSMVGLSGGGWTTTVYAALDERIKLSIPVAGSLPLPLRTNWSGGDEEQNHAPFYEIAGYTDLYVLGALEQGRRQVQVLNRNDDCCYGEREWDETQIGATFNDAVRNYEAEVRVRLAALQSSLPEAQAGSFRLEIDDAPTVHTISWNTIGNVILRELHRATPKLLAPVAADTFFRRPRGTLAFGGLSGIEDSGIPVVGVPAFAPLGQGAYEIFIRDDHNRLNRVSMRDETWTRNDLGYVVLTDPVLVVSKGRIDVTAVTTDYLPHHWRFEGGAVSDEVVPSVPKAFGRVSLSSYQDSGFGVFFRSFDRVRYGFLDTDDAGWIQGPAWPPSQSAMTR